MDLVSLGLFLIAAFLGGLTSGLSGSYHIDFNDKADT